MIEFLKQYEDALFELKKKGLESAIFALTYDQFFNLEKQIAEANLFRGRDFKVIDKSNQRRVALTYMGITILFKQGIPTGPIGKQIIT